MPPREEEAKLKASEEEGKGKQEKGAGKRRVIDGFRQKD